MENIVIKKNGDYEFSFEKSDDIDLKIVVNENVSCRIFEFTNNESEKKLDLQIGKNANVKHYSIVINTKGYDNFIKQDESSSYEFKAVNFADKNNYSTNASVELSKAKSFCDMKIINVAKRSRISSKGLIRIDAKSIGSQGHQNMIGVLLDDESSINAEPNLEVFNDDVICSHGASITQIDDEKLFYLTSKGYNKKQSVNLIVNGYFDMILSEMPKDFKKDSKKKLEDKNII